MPQHRLQPRPGGPCRRDTLKRGPPSRAAFGGGEYECTTPERSSQNASMTVNAGLHLSVSHG